MHKLRMFKVEKLTVSMLKAGLFALFLAPSMALQAAAGETQDHEPDHGQQQERQQEHAIEAGSDARQAGNVQGKYHHWPKREQINRELTPPPPPGPYMSTALSGNNSLRGHHCGSKKNRPASGNSQAAAMDMFSPDRPWPDSIRPAKRWLPENGYRYAGSQVAAPQVNNKPYPAASSRMPAARLPTGRNNGYRSGGYRSGPAGMNGPSGNWPTMNSSGPRWMPSMGSGPGNPYPVRPDAYQPGYNHGYNQPVNRPPYPPQGRP